jgi:hypothetical protein
MLYCWRSPVDVAGLADAAGATSYACFPVAGCAALVPTMPTRALEQNEGRWCSAGRSIPSAGARQAAMHARTVLEDIHDFEE